MARPVTLADLRARCRTRANVRNVKFTDTILDPMINQARLATLDEILAANPSFSITSDDIDIVSGQDYVSLPADFYHLYGVRVKDTNGLWKVIEPYSWEDQEDRSSNLTSRQDLRYTIEGTSRLRFKTAPGWSLTDGLRVHYTPVPADLASPGDTWDGVFGWDEHTVCQVALWIRESKDKDTTSILAQLQIAAARIHRRARNRNMVRAPRMRDGRLARSRANKLPWPV